MTPAFKDLVAYDIGGGWGSDVCQSEYESIGYVIRGTDIPRVAVGDVNTVPLRFHKASNLASRKLQSGDIVFEVSGGSKGQPVGRALQITDKILGRFDQPVMCASFCKLIRLDPGRALPGYVFRVLQAAYADGGLDSFQVQSTGITNFKWKPFLEHFKIELPDPEVQRRVASVMDSFDDLIENNRRRVEVLEEMARAIYREWFVEFRYPGHRGVPLVDSARGPIPENWTWGQLDYLVQVVKDTVDPSTLDPDTPAVGLEHIPRNQLTLDDWGVAGEQGSRKAVFSKGDVLFGKIRPYFHKVSVAPVDGISSTDAIVIRPVEQHWGEVAMVVSSASFVAHATQTSNGTKMPRADWKVLGQWPVAVPSAGLSQSFTGIVRDHLELAKTLMFENRRLSELRDLLLPKLVTGQIDVSTLDLDTMISTGLMREGSVAP
ncbi:hypothetical protein CH251_21565 [Rhodococcus sp. 06-462-5]|uniref:restriction endonuclease subunit S n=1 Tax=unclassified Rhodococcus (in: high G+C Gram-positive bacteria) TaxID=192944 RepID=UPI000B9AB5A4|nr:MULTISPECIES: restriction endonuclease subunit S [unclassified Rhodococcus (in: high G+C Gram-positive bacteria)]OZC67247.1 hypothetical protein CH251_21565 [Rhodococcus sp. 06-462-5]OZE65177.1 hypothetical protein CH270_14280 [Rhodococcus sp. 02-925g]